jgi:putative Ca2+/H+ antiporter (TMEM165/GDT1 family)
VDALLPAFVAALLAEWGDKTQLLVMALATRFRRPGPILAGVALAALANALLAAFGGVLIHDFITARATALLVAVSLLSAGMLALMRPSPPSIGMTWKTGAFLTSLGGFFLLEFGDKTQFLTFALAARYDSLGLTAAGATLGILAANVPAALLGNRLGAVVPVQPLRYAVAGLFLVTGFVIAVGALELV